MEVVKKIFQYALIFAFGFFVYFTIELLWDGSSTYAMGILGGLSLISIGALNDCAFTMKTPIWLQMIVGCIIITLLELGTGLVLNMDYHIWDYRDMPCNFMGQICLAFSGIWLILSLACILIQDYLNYVLFNADKPHYYWWFQK